MIENPILSATHPQEETFEPIVLGSCTNRKCDEEVFTGEGIEYNGELYCCSYCLGEHLIAEGHAVDLSKGY
jgi:hypothetical protein